MTTYLQKYMKVFLKTQLFDYVSSFLTIDSSSSRLGPWCWC